MSRRAFTVHGWRGDVAALLAGISLPFAFAPWNLAFLAMFAPALLFVVLNDETPARGFFRGWLFGLGQFGVGVSWVYVSIHEFGYTSAPVAAFLTGLFVAFLALFPGLFGWIANRWLGMPQGRRIWVRMAVALPALWTLIEFLRGYIFTGFPWLNLGYSQTNTLLSAYAPILGVYGVSWITAVCAALWPLTFIRRWRTWPNALPLLIAIWAVGGLLHPVEWTDKAGEPLTATLIQGGISQHDKWKPAMLQPTVDLYVGETRAHWDSDVIVWPENALPMLRKRATPLLQQLSEEARAHHSSVLLGLPERDPDSGQYYNSLVSLGADEGVWRKRHLVPFGDYLPLENWLRGVINFFDLPMSSFSAGADDQPPIKAAGHAVVVTICYEDAFGEEALYALPAARFLVNVSNDAWWGDSFGPHQHLQIARMRSIETRRPMLRATNTGITAIIDNHGQLVATAPQFEKQVLTAAIQPRQGFTPYIHFGNSVIFVVLLILIFSSQRLASRKT